MSSKTQFPRGRDDTNTTRKPLAPTLRQAATSISDGKASKAAGSLAESQLSALPADVSQVLDHFSTLDQQIYAPARLQESLNTLDAMKVSLVPVFDRMADEDRDDDEDGTAGIESTMIDSIDTLKAKLQNRAQLMNEVDLNTITLKALFENKSSVTRVEQSMARIWSELNSTFLNMIQLIDENGTASSANKENLAPVSGYTQGSFE